jgi:Type II CAAX prenyl endopeptidase Rce1-like
MNAADIVREIVFQIVLLTAVSPFVVMGLRGSAQRNRWKLIGLSVFVIFLSHFATIARPLFGIRQPDHWNWNWIGKLSCIVTTMLLFCLLTPELRQKTGILNLPKRDSALPVIGFIALCTIAGLLVGFAPDFPLPFDRETLAFQMLMPSLAEEPIFFGILPALLSSAMGNPWKIAGARLGSWWLAICVYFGSAHALDLSSQYKFQFDGPEFVAITLFTLPHGWIAARCGSVWPCVIGHSLNNSTAVAIGLFLK